MSCLAWGTTSEPELPLVLLQNKRYMTTLSGMVRLKSKWTEPMKTQWRLCGDVPWPIWASWKCHCSEPVLISSSVACLHTVSQWAVPLVNEIFYQTSVALPVLSCMSVAVPRQLRIRGRLSLAVNEMHYIFLCHFFLSSLDLTHSERRPAWCSCVIPEFLPHLTMGAQLLLPHWTVIHVIQERDQLSPQHCNYTQ